mmetsp:Transcript_95153/g.239771  ORF Transcript_95153/g.239771 Transcript_95153/m.239771 type:complete len:275 (-) Transcript_95153:576-1400(-)
MRSGCVASSISGQLALMVMWRASKRSVQRWTSMPSALGASLPRACEMMRASGFAMQRTCFVQGKTRWRARGRRCRQRAMRCSGGSCNCLRCRMLCGHRKPNGFPRKRGASKRCLIMTMASTNTLSFARRLSTTSLARRLASHSLMPVAESSRAPFRASSWAMPAACRSGARRPSSRGSWHRRTSPASASGSRLSRSRCLRRLCCSLAGCGSRLGARLHLGRGATLCSSLVTQSGRQGFAASRRTRPSPVTPKSSSTMRSPCGTPWASPRWRGSI